MKKVKALISMLTLAVMALTPMAAFAEDSSEGGEVTATQSTTESSNQETVSLNADKKTHNLKVSIKRASNYVVYVPESKSNLKKGDAITVSVSTVLEENNSVFVSVTSNNNWQLNNERAGSKYSMPYEMSVGEITYGVGDEQTKKVVNGKLGEGINDILESPFDAPNGKTSVTLVVDKVDTAPIAGTYSDTLTFTVSDKSTVKSYSDISSENPSGEDDSVADNSNSQQGSNESGSTGNNTPDPPETSEPTSTDSSENSEP